MLSAIEVATPKSGTSVVGKFTRIWEFHSHIPKGVVRHFKLTSNYKFVYGVSQDSSVGIATCCGVDSQGFESGGRAV